MKNENIIVALLIILAIAVIFQMTQLIGLYSKNTGATGQVTAGQEQFSSYEEMMEAHHGKGSTSGGNLPQQVGGC